MTHAPAKDPSDALVIFWITRRRARLGHPIGMGVSLCQILLALYLCYGSLE